LTHGGWIESVPSSWQVVPLFSVADYEVSNVDKLSNKSEISVRLCNYVDVYHNEFITLDNTFMEATATPFEISKFSLRKDDVIITKDSESWDDIGVPAHVRETTPNLVCGYHLAQIRPRRKKLLGSFLFRCLQAKAIRLQLELEANGVTRFGLPKSAIGSARLPLPPLHSQQKIADFLDAETARIDDLIRSKENLLAILAEKRRAIISHTVTRGFDSMVPMRDSSIPWLGEIPAHWKEIRLRFLVFKIEQGWSPQAEPREPSDDEWGVLKLSAVSRGRFIESAAKALPSDLKPRADYEVREGDFLLTRANTPTLVGDACFVEKTRPKLMLCDLIYRLALRQDIVDGRYLSYFLGLPLARSQIEADARGTSSSMVKIAKEHIKDWWVPLPPLSEQVEIVERLTKELDAIAKIDSVAEKTLALLRERREAVIAGAVTGQLDVEET